MKARFLSLSIRTLMALVMTRHISRHTGFFGPGARMSRRMLIKLGGLGLTALATGGWKSRSTKSVSPNLSSSSTVQCVLTPEQTEGPYYIAREKIRSNITENRPGTSLQLKLIVVDASTCKPIKNAVVDIWHCDAGGIYAGFMSASTGGPGGGAGPTDKRTFLRGLQRTNGRGMSRFQTIYPGWYRGRTVHIHVKVHLGGAVVGHVVHTGQLFFPDTLTHKVYQTGVYKSRAAARDTFNTSDSVYQSGGAQSTLSITHDGHGGYIGTITLGVRRA